MLTDKDRQRLADWRAERRGEPVIRPPKIEKEPDVWSGRLVGYWLAYFVIFGVLALIFSGSGGETGAWGWWGG